MKNSSNKDMKQVFEHLANIKTVEPNVNLYEKTVVKIQGQNVIPMFWVRTVACLLVAFISTQFYFTFSKNHSDSKDISSVIYKTNNILYHE
jgi:hypothetical protein